MGAKSVRHGVLSRTQGTLRSQACSAGWLFRSLLTFVANSFISSSVFAVSPLSKALKEAIRMLVADQGPSIIAAQMAANLLAGAAPRRDEDHLTSECQLAKLGP